MTTVITDPVTLLAQSVITLATGEYIEQAGTPTAQLARAQNVLSVATSIEQLISGDSNGLAGLQTALLAFMKATADQALQLAFNGLLAAILAKMQSFAGGSLLSKVAGVEVDAALDVIIQTAQAYITNLTPASAKP